MVDPTLFPTGHMVDGERVLEFRAELDPAPLLAADEYWVSVASTDRSFHWLRSLPEPSLVGYRSWDAGTWLIVREEDAGAAFSLCWPTRPMRTLQDANN